MLLLRTGLLGKTTGQGGVLESPTVPATSHIVRQCNWEAQSKRGKNIEGKQKIVEHYNNLHSLKVSGEE